jgi:antitoxin VapB
MALNIKSATAEQLARELASVTGVSITQAVTDALEAQLERARGGRRHVDMEEVRAIQTEGAKLGGR